MHCHVGREEKKWNKSLVKGRSAHRRMKMTMTPAVQKGLEVHAAVWEGDVETASQAAAAAEPKETL